MVQRSAGSGTSSIDGREYADHPGLLGYGRGVVEVRDAQREWTNLPPHALPGGEAETVLRHKQGRANGVLTETCALHRDPVAAMAPCAEVLEHTAGPRRSAEVVRTSVSFQPAASIRVTGRLCGSWA